MTATRADRPLRAAPARIDGLDGVRALAVAAAVAYHLDESAFPGGFLGVDVFFVLSGYLITTLLVKEWEGRGAIALRPFWRRRARRVLPSLLLTLAGVAVVTPSVFEDVARRVRGETLAALAQVGNWYEALADQSYFEAIGRPSPLRHLWSLGIEAQFYLLWPVVAAFALHRGGTSRLGRVAAAGGALSFGAMALLFRSGDDPSRIYYGTDTRVGTLLVGAVLAVAWPGHRLRRSISNRARRIVDTGGMLAVVGLSALVLGLSGTSPFAYRGGLLAAALLSAVLVAATVHPASRLGAVLAVPPLVWLGTRSYAVYLWHWPVITATRPGLDVDLDGWRLLAVRLLLTAALAEATTRFVDAALLRWRHVAPTRRRRLALAAACLLVPAATVAATTSEPPPAMYVSPTTTLPVVTTSETTTTTTTTTVPVFIPPVTEAPVTTVPPPPPMDLPPVPPDMPPATGEVNAVAVGESVLVAAGGEVQRAIGPGTVVDADVARQPQDVLNRLAARRAAGYLQYAKVVVVQMGTNGEIDTGKLERMAQLVHGVPRIVAVTIHVDRPWVAASNQALWDGAARWPWLRIADWHAAATAHPEWLASDGVHPNREGARQYAALVAEAARAP